MSCDGDSHVTSELYSQDIGLNSNPSQYVVTCFKFEFPSTDCINKNHLEVDEDGDLLVNRKNEQNKGIVKIEHKASTTIKLVGLQIWRGALLLADYILHNSQLFKDKTVLELGSGVGLTSIVAGFYSAEVVATDINEGGILDLISRNSCNNKHLMSSLFTVLPLDFLKTNWSNELTEKMKTVDIVLAADVIYDNDLTEGFVKTLTQIMLTMPKKIALIALEKRYVFTVADLDTVAPCYEHFLEYLRSYWNHPPMSKWNLREIKIDFKQYFEYERLKHLVLWEVSTE